MDCTTTSARRRVQPYLYFKAECVCFFQCQTYVFFSWLLFLDVLSFCCVLFFAVFALKGSVASQQGRSHSSPTTHGVIYLSADLQDIQSCFYRFCGSAHCIFIEKSDSSRSYDKRCQAHLKYDLEPVFAHSIFLKCQLILSL